MTEQLEQLAKGIEREDGNREGGWLDTWLDLRAAGLHWKKAAFVAWDAAPKSTRRPVTMAELAELLNYKSEQVFYKWRHQDWFNELGVEQARKSVFARHLADVDRVTIGAALNETGSPGVQARKLFYELAGVINPNRVEVANPEGDVFEVRSLDYRQQIAAVVPESSE